MKMVGIDIDALRTQAQTLRDQLTGIETIIRIASENGVTLPEQPRFAKGIPLQPPVRNGEAEETPRGTYVNIGARKAVTLALHTGPASHREISRALVWDTSKVKEVLSSMITAGLVSVSEGGIAALTDKGTITAQWFVANPQYVTYQPKRVAATA